MKFRSRLLAVLATALFAPVAVLAADAAAPAKEVAKEKPAPKKANAACDKPTGTRIKSSRQKDCEKASNRPLKSYSAEELAATGEIDLAKALRQLDPGIQ